jgi:hypothetical protein
MLAFNNTARVGTTHWLAEIITLQIGTSFPFGNLLFNLLND